MNKPQHIKPGDFLLGAGVIVTLGVVAIAAARNQPRDWEGEATQDLRRLARAYNLYAEAYDGKPAFRMNDLSDDVTLENFADIVHDRRYDPTGFGPYLRGSYSFLRSGLSLIAEPMTKGHFPFDPVRDPILASPITKNPRMRRESYIRFNCGSDPIQRSSTVESREKLVGFEDGRVAWMRGLTPYSEETAPCHWKALRLLRRGSNAAP